MTSESTFSWAETLKNENRQTVKIAIFRITLLGHSCDMFKRCVISVAKIGNKNDLNNSLSKYSVYNIANFYAFPFRQKFGRRICTKKERKKAVI